MRHPIAGKNAGEITETVDHAGGRPAPCFPSKIERHSAGQIGIRPKQAEGDRCDQAKRQKPRGMPRHFGQTQQRRHSQGEPAQEQAAAALRAEVIAEKACQQNRQTAKERKQRAAARGLRTDMPAIWVK